MYSSFKVFIAGLAFAITAGAASFMLVTGTTVGRQLVVWFVAAVAFSIFLQARRQGFQHR